MKELKEPEDLGDYLSIIFTILAVGFILMLV